MSNNNQFKQRNSEKKKQNENLDNISHKSNLNQNEKMTNDNSNDFSIFNIGNILEIDRHIKNKNELKKINICPFFGGQIYENPTPENTPNIKDNIDIFKGGQIENGLQIYKNFTKGGNTDNNHETDKGYNNSLDNMDNDINHRQMHNKNIGNYNVDNNNNINGNNLNINNSINIYNSHEGEDKEDEKIYTNDRDDDEKIYSNNGNYQQDKFNDNSGFANHYEYIKKYCEKNQRFPFFLKMDENEPEFILANKKLTLREILIKKNFDVENIDLYCKDYQQKVFLDETIESQNIRPFSYIQNNVN